MLQLIAFQNIKAGYSKDCSLYHLFEFEIMKERSVHRL